jgi:hypothetical protein
VNRTAIRLILVGLGAALAAGLGCNGGGGPGGDLPGVVDLAPGSEGLLLRFKYEPDRVLRYDVDFRARTDGLGEMDDAVRAVVYYHCLGTVDTEKGAGFHKVNITRRELTRNKKEVDAKGRRVPPVTAVRTSEPDITENYAYDAKRNKNYFPIDERGVFGLSAKRPFHRVWYDSVIYLLPVLPPGKVRAGSTWTQDLPVYTSAGYIPPAGEYRRGNDFKLTFRGRVDRVYERSDQAIAQISWSCSGTFDTQAYYERFPPNFHNRQRLIHEVAGKGQAVFNVTHGVIASQSGQLTVSIIHRMLVSKRNRDGQVVEDRWEEDINRHMLHYKCRLLPEGEPDPRPPGR